MSDKNILARIRSRFVDNWADCWRWASVRLAVVFGAVVAYFSEPSNWASMASAFYEISPEYRWFVPPLLGFAVAFVPIVLRIWEQGQKHD